MLMRLSASTHPAHCLCGEAAAAAVQCPGLLPRDVQAPSSSGGRLESEALHGQIRWQGVGKYQLAAGLELQMFQLADGAVNRS